MALFHDFYSHGAMPGGKPRPAGQEDLDLFNFEKLRLVEKPDNPRNSPNMPQNLKDCEGYLAKLPLRAPNVDQKNPKTISDMVGILTSPNAATEFGSVVAEQSCEAAVSSEVKQVLEVRGEGEPAACYNYKKSSLMTNHLSSLKKRSSQVRAPWVFGHVVNPGCISFYTCDGKTFAVTEGRWWLASTKAWWLKRNVSMDQDLIQPDRSKVIIYRVLPGEIGLVRENGVEILLDVGTHVFNSGTVTIVGKQKYPGSTHFSHGRYHYLMVPRGKLAKVWTEVVLDGVRSLVPRLLEQGEHFIDSHIFDFKGFEDIDQEYIAHGSVHFISVPKGFVARVFQETKPRLLGEGDHIIESTQFQYQDLVNVVSNNCIVHGTITILRVTLGQVGLVWKDSDPVFIDEPGLYEFDSPDFSFVEFKDAEERLIQLGARKIVLVHTGEVAVTYDQGLLKILDNGRHVINKSTHVFHRFLSTQQKSIRLVTLNEQEKIAKMSMKSSRKSSRSTSDAPKIVKEDSDLTVCETKDLVKVGLRADVFYSIADPEKCINKIETDELEDLVRETAIATLTNIIRSTALNEIAQSKHVSMGQNADATILPPPGEQDDGTTSPAGRMFFEKAHDEFLLKLHDDFMQRYGVDIANIRIESFKIMDNELADQISKHALTTAQIENEMANLEGKSLISTTQERTAADVKNICAEAEASALKTTTDAENQRKIDAAKADAEALKIAALAKAEAESEHILMKAKAEAEAIRLKARAEAERAEMLSNTNLGQQESLLGIYSDMVKKSNEGVEKVVYLDSSINRESTFAMGSLSGLNRDLHSLTQLGIVAEEAPSA